MAKRDILRYEVSVMLNGERSASIFFTDVEKVSFLARSLKRMGMQPIITAEIDEVTVPEETPTDGEGYDRSIFRMG